ncbi:hypothetical protein [sulfur-oxidizing endosymbiont of Gigantopelta aegis]|uniref:hypothetical protein n=1 Tax=sulfur-oxidizing endosymbiont of Gigantopelta aegis TaxID=2794934 RepID=UPI001BE46F99|nr:hypothetical protein [sulfur-oxidizing endosymbiont of Gigantopelta aegis]
MPELYFILLDREKAHNALKQAFIHGDRNAGNYPSNIADILVSIINLGSSFWQKEIDCLLVLFKENDVLAYFRHSADKIYQCLCHRAIIIIIIKEMAITLARGRKRLRRYQHFITSYIRNEVGNRTKK